MMSLQLLLLVAVPFLIALGFVVGVAGAYAMRSIHLARAGLVSAPLAFGALAALVVREAWAQMRIIRWFLTRSLAERRLAGPGGIPVVLAHGYAADGTCMTCIRRALLDRRPTYAPHLGRMFRPIERYGEKLVEAIEEALAEHPEAEGVDVVCHSMGGIALRQALRQRPALAGKIRRVVTIASPHAGTCVAAGLPVPEARQLHRAAPWLKELPTLRCLLPAAPITTIASVHDAVVYPDDSCCVDGATHHTFSGVGHAELLVRKDVADLVVQALA